jgi:hypothetical protein
MGGAYTAAGAIGATGTTAGTPMFTDQFTPPAIAGAADNSAVPTASKLATTTVFVFMMFLRLTCIH